VLVSQTVKDLVAGSGLTFDDAGEHELKGVPLAPVPSGEVGIYAWITSVTSRLLALTTIGMFR
jgi:hypothetical protein